MRRELVEQIDHPRSVAQMSGLPLDTVTDIVYVEGMEATTSHYDHLTGTDHDPLCRYCGTLARIIPEFRPTTWHSEARCVEGEEPVR